jgi:metalloendopeptidase OMA1, mitochondrial
MEPFCRSTLFMIIGFQQWRRSMGSILRVSRVLSLLLVATFVVACAAAPVTGRQQLILIPDTQAAQLGAQAFQQIVAEKQVVRGTAQSRMVEQVGRDIAAVVNEPYDWEFALLQDPTPNAFALPGGKVGVHTGLFQVAQNADQLAAVVGHEVAHVTARHSAERMTQELAIGAGLLGIGAATSPGAADIVAQAATLGVILPFSRTQEREADEIGLIYMAMAGYDPRAAIEVWRNFERLNGERPPEFLSTHPSPPNRIERLEALMPQALELYRQSRS